MVDERTGPGATWRRMRADWRWLVAGLAALALAGAGIPALNYLRYSPAQTVLSYLSALEHGDSAKALSLLKAPDADGGGISDKILDNAAGVPSKGKVGRVRRHDDGSATVSVSFLLGSSRQSVRLKLVPGPKTWGMFSSWAIDVHRWPTLDLSGGNNVVTLGGQDVTGSAQRLPVLFPVSYTVGSNAMYLRATPVRAQVVKPGSSVPVTLNGKPTAKLRRAVDTQIRKQLDTCVKQKVLMPRGCLVGYQTTAQILGDVKWSVKEYPDVAVRSGEDGLYIAPATGVFHISGRYRDAVTGRTSTLSEDVKTTITGSVRLDGKRVTVTQPSTTDKLGTAK